MHCSHRNRLAISNGPAILEPPISVSTSRRKQIQFSKRCGVIKLRCWRMSKLLGEAYWNPAALKGNQYRAMNHGSHSERNPIDLVSDYYRLKKDLVS
jgi:hypothetical protein